MTSRSQIRSSRKQYIYLDYAASTPVSREVFKAMEPYFADRFGNPGSVHSFGQESQAAIDKARGVITKSIGAKFNEIIFTGSATEANNLALRGLIKAYQHKSLPAGGQEPKIGINQRPRIIVSSIEHESVLDTARDLEKEGVEVIYLPVDKEGFISIESLKNNLTENTVLVSIIYASNEIGTVQPIGEISKLILEFRKQKVESRSDENSRFYFLDSRFPLLHTDAAQAFQFLDCDVDRLGVDLMTLSAHKIYGPKGIGALYVATRVQPLATGTQKFTLSPGDYTLRPIITGGGQEYGLRSGTENVPAVVGFGKAVEFIQKNKIKEGKRIKVLRDYFWRELKNAKPDIELNGPPTSSLNRLPNNLNVYIRGRDSRDLLIELDLVNVAVSAGSACSARNTKPSHIIAALNLGGNRAKSSLRISFGRPTTRRQLDTALKRIVNLL